MSIRAGILISIILVLLLTLRFSTYQRNIITLHDGEHIQFVSRVTDTIHLRGNTQTFPLQPAHAPVISITTTNYPEISYGQVLSVSGVIHEKVLSGKRAIMTMSFPKITLVPDSSPFYPILSFLRSRISQVFHKTLPPTLASLLMGIVFGIKEDMPKDFSDALRSTGVLHVIAASGMNITMVAGVMSGLFSRLFRRQLAILVTIVAIFLYAVFAGLEASILRAAIMASLAFSAALLGRSQLPILTLIITGYLMLLINPLYLTDVGFQLSFLSTLGILVIKPLFDQKKDSGKQTGLATWLDDIKTTLAAQIMTIPVMLMTFGQYGLLSLVVNALVLWTIPPLMISGSLAALCSLLFPWIASVFLLLSLPMLIYFQDIVIWFGSSHLVLALQRFPLSFVVGYYLLLSGIVLFFHKRQIRYEVA